MLFSPGPPVLKATVLVSGAVNPERHPGGPAGAHPGRAERYRRGPGAGRQSAARAFPQRRPTGSVRSGHSGHAGRYPPPDLSGRPRRAPRRQCPTVAGDPDRQRARHRARTAAVRGPTARSHRIDRHRSYQRAPRQRCCARPRPALGCWHPVALGRGRLPRIGRGGLYPPAGRGVALAGPAGVLRSSPRST